jgi:hypothetical protein
MHTFGKRISTLIVLGLLISAACESPTPVAPAEAGLSISANPTRITISGSTEITVIARKADGSAVNEGTEINFSTSLGTISPLIALTNDRGIASATLSGQGESGLALVEASSGAAAPVTLEVQIGAQATSLTLQANPPRIPKEGGTSTLIAGVADDLANPVEGTFVRFGTEAGSLASGGGSVETDSQGEAEDELTLTEFDVAGVREGFFLVTATTVGADGVELSQEFELEVGGFVESVTLTATPGTVGVSGGDFLLTAVVQDDLGDVVEGAGVIFSTDVGTLASRGRLVPSGDDGVAEDTLFISSLDLSAFGGSVINVSAVTSGLGNEDVVGTDQILVSDAIGIVTLVSDTVVVSTDVTTVVNLVASVFDDAGLPVADVPVAFTSVATCVTGVSVCGKGTLANEGQILVTNLLGQASTTLTVTPDDVTDDMGVQETSSITVTVEALILNVTLDDSVTITVTTP